MCGGGGRSGGGGEGHEGRGGKWQALGLRPQLVLLVQPHPGGEIGLLLLFARVGRGGAAELAEKMSPEVGRVYPRVPPPPQESLQTGARGVVPLLLMLAYAASLPRPPGHWQRGGVGKARRAATYCVHHWVTVSCWVLLLAHILEAAPEREPVAGK